MSERGEEITMQCVYGKCDVYVCVWKERERESESEETSRVALAILDAFPLPTFGRDALFASFAKNYRIAFPSHRNGLYLCISQMTEFHLFHPKHARIDSLRKHMTVSGITSYTVRSTTTSEEQTLDFIAYPCTHSMTSSVLVLVRVLNQHRRR